MAASPVHAVVNAALEHRISSRQVFLASHIIREISDRYPGMARKSLAATVRNAILQAKAAGRVIRANAKDDGIPSRWQATDASSIPGQEFAYLLSDPRAAVARPATHTPLSTADAAPILGTLLALDRAALDLWLSIRLADGRFIRRVEPGITYHLRDADGVVSEASL